MPKIPTSLYPAHPCPHPHPTHVRMRVHAHVDTHAHTQARARVRAHTRAHTRTTTRRPPPAPVDALRCTLQVKGNERPLPRSGHTACCIREKVFVFGGCTADGVLLNDVWMYDQESGQWSHVSTFGTVPSPRRGAARW